jgi:HEAT repeat protein
MKKFPEIINGIEVPYGKDVNELESMLNAEMPSFTVACIALGYKSDIESLNILAGLLSSKDWCKRRVVVEAIGYHSMGYLLSDELISLLDDKSKYVVITTLNTISTHSIGMARLRVLHLIKSNNEEIRKEAIACLISIGEAEDFQLITQIFLRDKSKVVKDEAAWFIRKKSGVGNWGLSIDLLKQSNLARHRVWACELIELYGDDTSIKLLTEMQNDSDGHIRKIACKIMDRLKGD